ncbi:hypothetical protein PQX77_003087 [Marasmius sp. AFHP31]|nr:hypothetical protein PQX77_003087 [Marasmius sp. AFHP31]
MTSRVQKGNAIFRPLAKQRSRPTPAPSQNNVNESPRPEITLATPPPQPSASTQLKNANSQQPQPSVLSQQTPTPTLVSVPTPTPIEVPLERPLTILPSNSLPISVPTPLSQFVPPSNSHSRTNATPVPLPAPAPPRIQSARPLSQVPVVTTTNVSTTKESGTASSKSPTRPQPQSRPPPPTTNADDTASADVPSSSTTALNQNDALTNPVETTNGNGSVIGESSGTRRTQRKRKSATAVVGDDGEMTEGAEGITDGGEDTESSEPKKKARKVRTKSKPASGTTTKPKKRTRKPAAAESSSSPDGDDSPSSSAANTPATKKPRRSKSKTQTPPFDETADPGTEIDPTSMTMAALCEDTGQGRVSSKAAEIMSNHEAWKRDRRERRARMRELMERKKYGLAEEEDEGDAGKGKEPLDKAADQEGDGASGSQTGKGSRSSSHRGSGTPGPVLDSEEPIVVSNDPEGFDYQSLQHSRFNVQVRIGPNGETIIDEESLVVDRVEGEQGEGEYEKVVESDMTKFVNSGTYGKRFRGSRWSKEETELFYDALAQYGENYELISYVLPGRDRKACKNKFKAEDKRDPGRINHCLNNRIPVDMKTLARMTGKDFSGPTPQIAAPAPPPPPPPPPLQQASDQQANSNSTADRGRKDKPGNSSNTKRSRSRTAAIVEDGVEVLGDVDGYAMMDD